MDKNAFLKDYGPKLRIWFNADKFLKDDSVTVIKEKIKLKQFLDFFVLRYKKNDKYDDRSFEDQKDDSVTQLITVDVAVADPKKWHLDVTKPLKLNELKAIPIATDTHTLKTLVLDSNHHIVSLIHSGLPSDTELPVIRIIGPNLDKIIGDFIVLSRQ